MGEGGGLEGRGAKPPTTLAVAHPALRTWVRDSRKKLRNEAFQILNFLSMNCFYTIQSVHNYLELFAKKGSQAGPPCRHST